MNPERQSQCDRATELAVPAFSPDHLEGGELQKPTSDLGTHQRRAEGRPPWWMYLIGSAFVAKAVFMTAFCFFGPEPTGIDIRPTRNYLVVSKVVQGAPAERAGIRDGDILVRANDRPITDVNYYNWFLDNVEIGKPFMLDLDRAGKHVRTVLVLNRRPVRYWSTGEGLVLFLNLGGQFVALAVAAFMVFMRPKHLLACVGALFLAVTATGGAAIAAISDGISSVWRGWPLGLQLLLWAANLLVCLGEGVVFTFFALFPRPSFRNRWIWVLVWTPIILASLLFNYQVWHVIYSPENMIPANWMSILFPASCVTYVLGSFAVLTIKYFRLNDETEKRRVRLFVVSLACVVVSGLPVLVYNDPQYSAAPGASLFRSVPLRAMAALVTVAFPICFAYAILRHRLFDIRIIIRQSIRYAAAKQLLLLAVPAVIGFFLLDLYLHRGSRVDSIVQDRGWIYLGLAGIGILAHVRRQQWLRSLDRRFFREQYNAQEILSSTLAQMRAATNIANIAPTVVKQIGAAMHPVFCAMLEQRAPDKVYRAVSVFPDQAPAPQLSVDSKIVEITKLIGKPVQFPERDDWLMRQLDPHDIETLRRSGIELLAPIRNGERDSMIVLGAKRSEEPYTSEDLRLVQDLTVGLGLLPSSPPEKEAKAKISKECPSCHNCYDITDEVCSRDGSTLIVNSFPRRLGERFRLEFRLGQGGMGKVYEATDEQLQRKVALKVILEDWIKDPAALDRFRREAHLLASFQHPNVVTLFDAGLTEGGYPFLVMERLQGRTLREELNSKTTLPADEIGSVVHQVCAALSAAHQRSLIHRDLKPENIFLCNDRLQRVIKVLDFGLAKLFAEASDSTRATSFSTVAGLIIGTPAYMAPELLAGAKPDRSCDIWALAVITFEMLTGHLPALVRGSGFVDTSATELPPLWRNFFQSCLSQGPSDRPASIEIFRERFDECAGSLF